MIWGGNMQNSLEIHKSFMHTFFQGQNLAHKKWYHIHSLQGHDEKIQVCGKTATFAFHTKCDQ